MATKKKRNVKNKKQNKDFYYFGDFKIKKKTLHILIIAVVALTIGVFWRKSTLWPWPSQDEINQRLDEVIDACIYNERSRACKNLTNKYDISFEYCHALSDIPEIDKKIPVYGVAKLNTFTARTSLRGAIMVSTTYDYSSSSVTSKIEAKSNDSVGNDIYPYYACVESVDEISRQTGTDLISNPETIALFELSSIPQYYETYEPVGQYGCTFHRPGFPQIWKSIPNISIIYNEADNILNTYNKCNMRAESDRAINALNAKLSNYAKDYSVQLFYKKYDEWNNDFLYSCTLFPDDDSKRKIFDNQTCMDIPGSKPTDFASKMYEYLHSDSFTSKIVVVD